MSSNLVIVAIPARDEDVWKVSSEKVPHLTICFLGENTEDVPKVDRIVDFVEHCVESSEHGSFMLDVDERGTLGEDSADVLFFQKGYSFRWINQFRNQLLQQTDIREAYESVDQYPEWQPHLTLGYPETPANEDEIPEHGLRWINFDRIAVWTGDFEGPEFKLRWPERELETALSMSLSNEERKALGLDATMEHFGIKGMRWGARKETPITIDGKTTMVSKRQAAKADKKWKKDFEGHKGFGFDDQKFTNDYNAKWKDHDFSKEDWSNPSPTYKKYEEGYFKEMNREYTRQYAEHFGSSPTGKMKVSLVEHNGEPHIKLTHNEVQHTDEVSILFKVTFDDKGLIVGLESVEDSMSQTVKLGAEFIEHIGIKGMKWGVRKQEFLAKREAKRVSTEAANRQKRPAQDVKAFPTIGVSKRQKGWVDTKGGEDHPPAEDAIKVAVARQKMKKSGIDALTNDELREVANRLNLEVQVDTLESKAGRKSLGRQFIEGLARDKQTQRKAGEYALKTAFNTVA